MQRAYQQQLVLASMAASTAMLQRIIEIESNFDNQEIVSAAKAAVKGLLDYNDAVQRYALREQIL